jgi:hypothetical protein
MQAQWVDSVIERRGPELIWIDIKGDASMVSTIRPPDPLPIKEAIPELTLVDACPDVVEFVGAKGGRLQMLVANPLSIEDAEAFASGTRLPIERRTKRSQTVEGAKRAKVWREKNVQTLPRARKVRSEGAAERREKVLAVAREILAEINKPNKLGLKPEKPSVHELAGLVAAKYPEHEGYQEGDWKPTRKAASHILAEARGTGLKGKIKPPQNRSRD